MIFRRRRPGDGSTPEGAEPAAGEAADSEASDLDGLEELDNPRAYGPWDRSETARDQETGDYVDFGGLLVKPPPDHEIQLQLDEESAGVVAILVAGPDSAVELRAFAAPRLDSIWDSIRKEIASEAAKGGGTATEADGEFGIELRLAMPVQTPEGRTGTQVSRIVGVDGPRWMLRGTFLGKSAEAPDPDGAVETAFRDTIVVRGSEAMLPREMIPMRLPPQIEVVAGEAPEAEPVDEADEPDDGGRTSG